MQKISTPLPLVGKGGVQKANARRLRQEQMAAWVGVHEPNTKLIPLGNWKFAKVDSDMYDFLNQWNWSYKKGYARRNVRQTEVQMHQVVLHCEEGFEVDHRNLDTLDNRRSNLRKATSSQNKANVRKRKSGTSSSFKGVSLDRRTYLTSRWYVRASDNGNPIYLGRFKTEREAALAYNKWASKRYGEFALLNPVQDSPHGEPPCAPIEIIQKVLA